MPSSNGSALDLTVWGISDTELLAVVDDLADEDGWTPTMEVRLQLGENPDQDRRSGVPTRLSWMRRYGWLEKDLTPGVVNTRYRLTAMGHSMLDNPKLLASFEKSLNKLNPAQRIKVTQEVATGAHDGAVEVRTALRRQWNRSLRVGR